MKRPAADPSGILERVPELLAFSGHPSVKRAVERGRPFAVYRALFWLWIFRRIAPEQRPVAEMLIGRRRLFAEPIRRTPALFTFNSVGTSAYGQDELDEHDGGYVLTQFLVAGFAPIFPLGAYLVSTAPEGGWFFHGRVPFGTATFLWNRSILVGLGLAVLLGIGATIHSTQYGEVHVANALPIPVHVEIGGVAVELGAGGRPAALEVSAGRQAVVVRDRRDGRVLERGQLDVQPGERPVVWNVLGAAPVFREDIVYTSGPAGRPPPEEPLVFCGRREIRQRRIDFMFARPPDQISMSTSETRLTRSYLDVAPGGYDACVQYLAGHGRIDEAADLAERVAEALALALEPTGTAVGLLEAAGKGDRALRLAVRGRDAQPASVEAHRSYQNAMAGVGRRAEVRREYAARAVAHPDSADDAYLALRMLPSAEVMEAGRSALVRHPRHGLLRRLMGHTLYGAGRWDEAAETWLPLRSDDPAAFEVAREHVVRALARAGRTDEALPILEDVAADDATPLSDRVDAAVLYARVARAQPGLEPLQLFRGLPSDHSFPETLIRVRARLPVAHDELAALGDEGDAEVALLWVEAGRDPERALAQVVRLGADRTRGIDLDLWVLLFAEAVRRDPAGQPAAILREAGVLPRTVIQAIDRFVRDGTVSDEIDGLPPPDRCGLWLVRSRVASLDAGERETLRERALREDVLGDVATPAAESWPPP